MKKEYKTASIYVHQLKAPTILAGSDGTLSVGGSYDKDSWTLNSKGSGFDDEEEDEY